MTGIGARAMRRHPRPRLQTGLVARSSGSAQQQLRRLQQLLQLRGPSSTCQPPLFPQQQPSSLRCVRVTVSRPSIALGRSQRQHLQVGAWAWSNHLRTSPLHLLRLVLLANLGLWKKTACDRPVCSAILKIYQSIPVRPCIHLVILRFIDFHSPFFNCN